MLYGVQSYSSIPILPLYSHFKILSNILSSIGGISKRIKDILKNISELEVERKDLKEERGGGELLEKFRLEHRLAIGLEITALINEKHALTLQITALTYAKVELMRVKALAGMARSYLS